MIKILTVVFFCCVCIGSGEGMDDLNPPNWLRHCDNWTRLCSYPNKDSLIRVFNRWDLGNKVYLDCIFRGARVVPQSLIDQETTKRPKGNADVMALKNWMMEDYHDWKTESIADVIEKYAYSLPPSDRALMLSEILSFL